MRLTSLEHLMRHCSSPCPKKLKEEEKGRETHRSIFFSNFLCFDILKTSSLQAICSILFIYTTMRTQHFFLVFVFLSDYFSVFLLFPIHIHCSMLTQYPELKILFVCFVLLCPPSSFPMFTKLTL